MGFRQGWGSRSLCTPQPPSPGLTSAQPALQQPFCLGLGSPGSAPYALHLAPCILRTPTHLLHSLHPPFHTPESPSQSPEPPSHPLQPMQPTAPTPHLTPCTPVFHPHPCQFFNTGASSPDPLPSAPASTAASTETNPPSSPAARTAEPPRGHSEGRHGGEPPAQSSPACPPRAAALLPHGSSWSPAALAGTAPVNSSSKCSRAGPIHTPEIITLDTLRDRKKS